jgi:hypothetical protein
LEIDSERFLHVFQKHTLFLEQRPLEERARAESVMKLGRDTGEVENGDFARESGHVHAIRAHGAVEGSRDVSSVQWLGLITLEEQTA